MDSKIIWTERASSDIEAIVRYIARRNPGAASRIGLGIYERVHFFRWAAPGYHQSQRRRTVRLKQS